MKSHIYMLYLIIDMKRTPFLHIFIIISFLINTLGPVPLAQAQDFRLPAPGVMVRLSPPLDPPMLKGIKVHPDNPFRFDFILDKGDSGLSVETPLMASLLKQEATKLIKYFLASLTIPEKDLWVNLSPYEKDRIIPNSFGLTEMGRDLLAEDYMLKQITASLIYPEDGVGKKFWKRIYQEAQKKYGTTNIAVNTFNKVWIIPQKAVVYENTKSGTAYVVESKLKVMLEQDYLALSKNTAILSVAKNTAILSVAKNTVILSVAKNTVILSVAKDLKVPLDSSATPQNDVNALGSKIVREIVIPELSKEVNENKNFSQLRQIYNSLILAYWYKKKIKDNILEQVYANKNKVAGVNIDDPQEKEKIYQRYLKAFKKGVYNYIKEDADPVTQETVPRKYFSGGTSLSDDVLDAAMRITTITPVSNARELEVSGNFAIAGPMNNLIEEDLRPTENIPQAVLNMLGIPDRRAVTKIDIVENKIRQAGKRSSTWLLGFEWNSLEGRKRIGNVYYRYPLSEQENEVYQILQHSVVTPSFVIAHDRLFQESSDGENLLNVKIKTQSDLIGICQAVGRVLGELHALGIRHRDLGFNLEGEPNFKLGEHIFINNIAGKFYAQLIDFNFSKKDSQWWLWSEEKQVGEDLYKFFDYYLHSKVLYNLKLPEFYKIFSDSYKEAFKKERSRLFAQNGQRDQAMNIIEKWPSARFVFEGDRLYQRVSLKAKGRLSPDEIRMVTDLFDRIILDGVLPTHLEASNVEFGQIRKGRISLPGQAYLINDDIDLRVKDRISLIEKLIFKMRESDKRRVNGETWLFHDPNHEIIDYLIREMWPRQLIGKLRKLGFSSETIWAKLERINLGAVGTYSGIFLNLPKEEQNAWAGRFAKVFEMTNPAMTTPLLSKSMKTNEGGIDLTLAKGVLQTKNSGSEIKFHLDPAQLAQLQNAPGFVPVIINIQPLKSLSEFLGIEETVGNSEGVG